MSELRLSNSEMKEYQRCRRKWYLSTYRRLGVKRIAPGTPFAIGDLVHDSLAAYYEDGSDPVEFAKARIAARIKEDPTEEIALEKDRELATIMLQGYLEWLEETGADSDLIVEGTETMVEVPLVEGVTLISKLDAPVMRESDGMKMALEHKTVQSLSDPLTTMKINSQFLTEHLARFLLEKERGATPDEAITACAGILVNALRKVKRGPSSKPPYYGRVDVTHNVHELRSHWVHVVAIAGEIRATRARLDAGESHHTSCMPNPTNDCSWDCPFFKVCAMADDGSDFEGALANLYVERDPLERYADAVPLAEVLKTWEQAPSPSAHDSADVRGAQ